MRRKLYELALWYIRKCNDNTKVYIITKGCYSDYHICAVSLDKKEANLLAERFSDSYEKAEIEEYDTNDYRIALEYKNIFSCWYYNKTGVIKVSPSNFDSFIPKDQTVSFYEKGLYTCVIANEVEEALKIASDRFAKYRAEHIGL